MVETDDDDYVQDIKPVSSLQVQENGGYFFFTPEIFDYLHEGEDLVTDALPRLAAERRLLAWPHDGFWKPADTVKERSELDALARRHRAALGAVGRGASIMNSGTSFPRDNPHATVRPEPACCA